MQKRPKSTTLQAVTSSTRLRQPQNAIVRGALELKFTIGHFVLEVHNNFLFP